MPVHHASLAKPRRTRTQNFTYDALNRLTSAGDQTHWSNTYTYDPWGNLTNKTPGALAGENLQKSADSNNHLSGVGYDAAGNETSDGSGGGFVYDAENHIISTAGVTYTYDADGRRVKKSSGTNYWYGPSGAALAETDANGNWTNYIFFGGERLARNMSGDIKYYITDHLHSTAMFVDKAGTSAAILNDNDFYPWGGVVPGVGKTSSNNTVKFTGQYRDTESNLDYFGARYYANTNGRFMSPDWAAKPTSVPYAEFGDPQSLNLYSYVRNSPVVRVDADGHFDDPFNVFGGGGAFSNIGSRDSLRFNITVTTTYTVTTYGDGNQVQEITNVHSEITDVSLAAAQQQSQNIANAAANQEGSGTYEYQKRKGNFPANTNKCNEFVDDTIASTGVKPPRVAKSGILGWLGFTRPLTAKEWATLSIPGWSAPDSVANARPGDVIAVGHTYDAEGHVGIVVSPGWTASANAKTTPAGIITVNNWGFRPAGYNDEGASAVVVRHYLGGDQ